MRVELSVMYVPGDGQGEGDDQPAVPRDVQVWVNILPISCPEPGPHSPHLSFSFRGPSPGPSGRPGPSDVITLDGPPEPPMMRMPIRAPIAAPRGGARGRGGRRGRPRLDPDTDLDFSPEPSNMNSAMILARLQQAGVNVSNTGAKSSNSNES